MRLDEVFGLLFFLYILGSILGALRRGAPRRERPAPPSPEEPVPGQVVDMDELERRLRRLREAMLGQPPQTAGEGTPPVVVPAAQSPEAPAEAGAAPAAPVASAAPTEPSAARPTVRPSPMRSGAVRPSALRPAVSTGEGETWAGWDDWPVDELDSVAPRQSRRDSVAARRPGDRRPVPAQRSGVSWSRGGWPPAAAALADRGQPWLAAVVIKEVWDPPRALRPYRIRPRV